MKFTPEAFATPYVYQGEELGMTNAYFAYLEDYRDVETLNIFKEYLGVTNITELLEDLSEAEGVA